MREYLFVEMDMPESCPCELASGYDVPLPCFAAHGVPKRCKEFDECVENGTKPDWCPIKGVINEDTVIAVVDGEITYPVIKQEERDSYNS